MALVFIMAAKIDFIFSSKLLTITKIEKNKIIIHSFNNKISIQFNLKMNEIWTCKMSLCVHYDWKNLILQISESILHSLVQLLVVGLDLSLTILNRILNEKIILKHIRSGAFSGKILLVRIIKNNKTDACFGSGYVNVK